MSEQSEIKPSSVCGHDVNDIDTTLEVEYENINLPITQAANSSATGMGHGNYLGKKPKPGPKPSYVAVKVAELQEKINSNESSPPAQRGSLGPTPRRPPTKDRSSQSTDADDHLYDRAVRVNLGVLQQVAADAASADVPEESSPTSTTANSPGSKIYAKPKRSPKIEIEDPIYDEANHAVSPVDDEPLYDDPIAVRADKMQPVTNTRCLEPEPLYEEPDNVLGDGSHTASTPDETDEDMFLYEEALPVNRMAISAGEV